MERTGGSRARAVRHLLGQSELGDGTGKREENGAEIAGRSVARFGANERFAPGEFGCMGAGGCGVVAGGERVVRSNRGVGGRGREACGRQRSLGS